MLSRSAKPIQYQMSAKPLRIVERFPVGSLSGTQVSHSGLSIQAILVGYDIAERRKELPMHASLCFAIPHMALKHSCKLKIPYT